MPSPRLHIVHLVYRFDTGGLENGMVNLINSLGVDEYRHSIVTLKGHNPAFSARITADNVQLFDLTKRDGNDFAIFWRLNRLLKQLKPDIVHTRNTATLELQLVAWFRGIKLRIHGEHGWDVNDMHGQNVRYQKLRRFLKKFVHQYVALSSEARDYLLNIIKIESTRVNHICNGVDVERFSPRSLLTSILPATFENCFVIGAVGRLAEVKNHSYLLEAFIELTKLHPDSSKNVRLLIVGDGILKENLVARAKEAGIYQKVCFAGDRGDIPELLNSMDIFVLPSLAEGISNTILEAMACGLPTIACDTGGNPDLIPESLKSDHLIPVNNIEMLVSMMKKYIESQQLLNRNSKLVRTHCVENFSIVTMVNKYHQLYHSISR